jgi:hypothetical protein
MHIDQARRIRHRQRCLDIERSRVLLEALAGRSRRENSPLFGGEAVTVMASSWLASCVNHASIHCDSTFSNEDRGPEPSRWTAQCLRCGAGRRHDWASLRRRATANQSAGLQDAERWMSLAGSPGRGSLSTAKRFRLRLTPTQKRKCPRTSGKSRCMCSECGATHSKQASIDCAALVGSAAFMCLTRTDYQRSDAITQAGPQRGSRRCSDSWLVSVGYRLGPRTILEPPEGEEAVVECHPSGPFRLAERRRLLGDLSVLP